MPESVGVPVTVAEARSVVSDIAPGADDRETDDTWEVLCKELGSRIVDPEIDVPCGDPVGTEDDALDTLPVPLTSVGGIEGVAGDGEVGAFVVGVLVEEL